MDSYIIQRRRAAIVVMLLGVGLGDHLVLAENLHIFGQDKVEDQRERGADAVRRGQEDEDAVADCLFVVFAFVAITKLTSTWPEGAGAVGGAEVSDDIGHHGDAEADAHGNGEDHAVAAGVEVRAGSNLEA